LAPGSSQFPVVVEQKKGIMAETARSTNQRMAIHESALTRIRAGPGFNAGLH
jgi:hypothetical protein